MALSTGVADRYLIRRINRAVILRLIRELAPVSRTDLVDAAQLSPATVSGITAELLRDGLIVERETGRSTGGRRPILLTIEPGAGLAIGVKLTEDRVIAAITDFQGTIVDGRNVPLSGRDPDAVGCDARPDRHRCAHHVSGARVYSDSGSGWPVRSTGTAGSVASRRSCAGATSHCDSFLRRLPGLPTVIENDVGTLTIAERWFGAGVGERDFLVVTLGRGVGLGMILDGRPYRGARGQGGEFGHTTIGPGWSPLRVRQTWLPRSDYR